MKSLTLIIKNHQAVSWNALYEQQHWSKRHELAQTIHEYMLAALPPAWKTLDWAISSAAALTIAFLALSWLGGGALNLSVSSSNFLSGAFSGIANILPGGELKSLYFPSPNEWLSSFGLIGLTITLGAIGWQVLPLESAEDDEAPGRDLPVRRLARAGFEKQKRP